jgi:hypothetical protein
MTTHAQPILSSAAASIHGAAIHALELPEARQLRDSLKLLLRKEQAAMAEFLVALADFDRRRGWEPLGHASFFAFLHFELGLSNSAAFYRMSAARLLQRFPDLVEPIRDGRLCLSTTAELAKVLTEENRAEVAPRFFGLSAREGREVVVELVPRERPPLRAVVTSMERHAMGPEPTLAMALAPWPVPSDMSQADADSELLLTSEEEMTHPVRVATPRDDVEPLTGDLRRLHITVSRQFLKKVETARDVLSHAIPGATMEQVLEAALDLLLEKQAKARGLVKRPRTTLAVAARPAEEQLVDTTAQGSIARAPGVTPIRPHETPPPLALIPTEPSPTVPPTTEPRPLRREGPREPIPAAVRRAVWERDAGRCTWPLDGGGCCGSTHRLELDHVIPWAEWGPSTVENLRVVCGRHNAVAARQAFGSRCVARYAGGRPAPP